MSRPFRCPITGALPTLEELRQEDLDNCSRALPSLAEYDAWLREDYAELEKFGPPLEDQEVESGN